MAFAQAASNRPIRGAVATLGVSDRIDFLRKTYAHLGGALIALALLTGLIIKYATNFSMQVATVSPWIVLIVFIGGNIFAQRLAMSESSRATQYAGLGLAVTIWAFFLQGMIWFVIAKFGGAYVDPRTREIHYVMTGTAMNVILQSVVITLAIFIGLTVTVFVTRKDFSFLRGVLSIALWAMIGVGIASWIFGFTFGALLSGVVVLIMAGYILYQTSMIMNSFPPRMYVAAALMLFGTVATLFIHVLNIVASRDR
ncbi:MAG TPA: Bax inhibitor-1 family protein [Kofleriaceae bacterium]|nr:Bax inhibitor-1 family protein [Kofleriaceae bacterium]